MTDPRDFPPAAQRLNAAGVAAIPPAAHTPPEPPPPPSGRAVDRDAGLTHSGLAGSAEATVAHGNLVAVLTVGDRVWFGTPEQARALAAALARQADHAEKASGT